MSRLAERIATPEGKRRYVGRVFATIAGRYDLVTVLLSYGQDRRWKQRLIALASPDRGTRALDLATGTGDLAFASAARGATVIALDVTPRMIELARAKPGGPGGVVRFVIGDMMALPVVSSSIDLVTTGYGLRNVPDLRAAVDEIARVLRPGGELLSLDFDRPPNRIIRAVYLRYLAIVGGALGWILHGDPDVYRYIPASIRQYPGAAAVADLLRARGFARVTHYRVLGGLMAIHQARKDAR